MPQTCPTTERWKDHIDGALSADEQAEMTAHLDRCSSCQEALDTLAASESMLRLARQSSVDKTETSLRLQHVLDLAKAGVKDGATLADVAAPPPADDHHYFAPAETPGNLGRLKHYEIVELLGKGGFGSVFRAFDTKLHRVVAIKVLAPEFAVSGTARNRFAREARAAAPIKNEHIVAIHNVEDEHRPPYIVMEFVDGATLQERLDREAPFELKEILRIGVQIAEGLAAAHKFGLVHRDIKPANILLENGVQRIKITDFGLARTMDDASVTQSGVIAGTPMYMSPEQAEGHPVDVRSDLFSLGTVLYVMCTGRLPFRASGTMGVLKRVVEGTPRPIREINTEMPQWLCDVVEKLHAKRPEDRFQTAQEVADLLRRYLAELQLHGGVTPVKLSKNGSLPAVALGPSGGWGSRRRKLALAAVLVLVALGALAVVLVPHLWRPADPPAKATLIVQTDDPDLTVEVLFHGVVGVAAIGGGPERSEPPGPPRFPMKATGAKTHTFQPPPGEYEVRGSKGGKVYRREIVALGAGAERRFTWNKADGWEQLFNGSDLTGWKTPQADVKAWTVLGGMLAGKGSCQYFFSVAEFQDFHLRAELRINHTGDSGIYFRSPYGVFGFKNPRGEALVGIDGYEAQAIGNFCGDHTGDLGFRPRGLGWGVLKRTKEKPPPDNTWFLLEIIAQGNRIEIKVDGKTTVEHVDTRNTFTKGHIVLESFRPETAVYFRKIEIKTLPPATEPRGAVDLAAFGQWIDPRKDCTHEVKGGKLKIAIPPGVHKLDPPKVLKGFPRELTQNQDAPRLLQEVEGDFLLQVHVDGAFLDMAPAAADKTPGFHGAGLLLWEDENNFLELLRYREAGAAPRFGPFGNHFFALHKGEYAGDRVSAGEAHPYLQIERRGDALFARCSSDGKTWQDFTGFDKPFTKWKLPKKLKVGLVAVNEMARVVAVTFDGFQLARGDRPLDAAKAPPPAVAPFDAKKAKEHQDAWAKRLGVPVEITNSLGMKLRLIPPGEFTMGSSKEEIDWLLTKAPDLKDAPFHVQDDVRSEGPQRRVTVREPFYFAAHEVTVKQFHAFVKDTGYETEVEKSGGGFSWSLAKSEWEKRPENTWKGALVPERETEPVVFIGLEAARAFCAWLSKREGRRYVLPTEEQWEYACRAGTTTRWHFGDDPAPMKEYGWTFPDSTGRKHPVGSLATNPFGLFDLYGNASEMTLGADGKIVWRGGDAGVSSQRSRSASRHPHFEPKSPNFSQGFRVLAVSRAEKAPEPAVAPFDAAKAKEHQDAWAKHLGLPVEITNSIGMKLRLIPPGEFTMGTPAADTVNLLSDLGKKDTLAHETAMLAKEGAPHPVRLTQAHYLATFEVTHRQFRRFVEATGYKTDLERTGEGGWSNHEGEWVRRPEHVWSTPGPWKPDDDDPVVLVTFDDAQAFCAWLTKVEGRSYALPTDAQWEFACRAGTTGLTHAAAGRTLNDYAWTREHLTPDKTLHHPRRVGSKMPNAFGLFDMLGNAWEHCADWYEPGPTAPDARVDPTGPAAGPGHVLRGGAWYRWGVVFARSGCRMHSEHERSDAGVGFRVAIVGDLKAGKAPVGAPK